MEAVAVILVLYVLLAPVIAVAVALIQRKRHQAVERRVGELESELTFLREQLQRQQSAMAKTVAQHPEGASKPAPTPPLEPEEPIPPVADEPSPAPEPSPASPEVPGVTRPIVEGAPAKEKEPPPVPAAARQRTEPIFPSVAAARVSREEDSEPVQREAPLVAFLRSIGCWPPAAEEVPGGREAVLMQWWLPRIGGLLALLSALFFGVYINQSTSTLVKFIELAAVSGGVIGLGLFLERKHRQFGGVIFVTGLIMAYLTSVAAYALPAVKVIANPLIGSLLQLLVLVAIVLIGLLRRANALIFLAYAFGLFLSVFMAWTGLREGALIASALLVWSGMALVLWRGLHRLAWILVPGAFVIPLAHVISAGLYPLQLPETVSVLVFLHVVFAWWPLLSLITRTEGFDVHEHRLLTALHTSLALLAGILYFRTFAALDLEWLYLSLGVHFLAWGVVYWLRWGPQYHALLFFTKGSFLISAWLITLYAGDLRWMTLALQTVVLTVTARLGRRRIQEALAWATGLIALYLHFDQVTRAGYPEPFDFVWWMHAMLPLVLLLGFSWMLPVFESEPPAGANLHVRVRRNDSRVLYGIGAVVAAGLTYRLIEGSASMDVEPSRIWILYAFAGGAIALLPGFSRWLPAWFSFIVAIAAAFACWNRPFDDVALGLILIWVLLAVWQLSRVRHHLRVLADLAETVIWLAWLPAVASRLLLATQDWPGEISVLYLAGAVTLVLGRFKWPTHLGGFAFLIPFVGLVALDASVELSWAIVSMAGAFVFYFLPVTDKAIHLGLGFARQRQLWSWIGAFVVWTTMFRFQIGEGSWVAWSLLFTAASAVFFAGFRYLRLSGSLLGAVLFAVSAGLYHLAGLFDAGSMSSTGAWSWELLVSGVALTVLLLAASFVFDPQEDTRWMGRLRNAIRSICALSIFGVWATTFYTPVLGWRDVYTPLIAAVVFGLILLGLLLRDRAYRWIGVALLLFPLLRLFIIDVQDALYRIIAFGVSAVCLAGLGFLYHKLSTRLGERTDLP